MSDPREDETRAYAAITLALMILCLLTPTHALGDTAVFGDAFLWGESSSRCNQGRAIRWFVDDWEVLQHALFGVVVVGAAAALLTGEGQSAIAVPLALLLALDLRRSIDVDGARWWALTSGAFWVAFAWTGRLLAASLRRISGSRSRGGG